MTFHDFFHDLFKFSTTLGLTVTFESFQNFPCFSIFLKLNLNRNKLWYPPKCVLFALFNYSSSSYVVLVLSSAVTELPWRGSKPVSTVLRKSVRFFIRNIFLIIIVELSKLKSGKWSTGTNVFRALDRNRGKGTFARPRASLEACSLGPSFRKSVSIFPRSAPATKQIFNFP